MVKKKDTTKPSSKVKPGLKKITVKRLKKRVQSSVEEPLCCDNTKCDSCTYTGY